MQQALKRTGLVITTLWLAFAATAARAETGEISIIVLKEHGVGSPTLAQPYVDRFVALTAAQNRWGGAKGRYLSSRGAAEAFIKAHGPHYGMLSLAAFLALREPYRLEVLGRVASTLAGGQQYFVVSRTAQTLAACKGGTLASDHTDDRQFIERVVARGAFKLAEFELMQNQRPLLGIKQVMNGEAQCALIDEAQLAELEHLDGGSEVRVVWKSEKLPPMAVVAFPAAPAAERKVFQASLARLCDEAGQTACAEVGIRALGTASAKDYAGVVSAYGR